MYPYFINGSFILTKGGYIPEIPSPKLSSQQKEMLERIFPITGSDKEVPNLNIDYTHAKPEPRMVEADRALKRKMSASPELTPEKAAKIIDACEIPDFTSNIKRKSIKPDDISTSKGNINDGVSR
jgi:hypothetical protein